MAQTQPVTIGGDAVQKDVEFVTGKLIQLDLQVFSYLLPYAAYQSLKYSVLRNGYGMSGQVFDGCIKEMTWLQPGVANLHKVVEQRFEVLTLLPFTITRKV